MALMAGMPFSCSEDVTPPVTSTNTLHGNCQCLPQSKHRENIWPDCEIRFYVDDTFEDQQEVDIDSAIAEWNRHIPQRELRRTSLSCESNVSLTYKEPSQEVINAFTTILNNLNCNHSFPTKPFGLTFWDPNQQISNTQPISNDPNNRAFIELYSTTDWIKYDFYATALHEIGHSLGLVHDASNQDALMYCFYNGQSQLQPADINAVTNLFPANCNQTSTSKNIIGTVTDIDGNIYTTIQIGTQVWMAENLRVTRYRNRDPLPNVSGDAAWESLYLSTTGAYCSYGNNDDLVPSYGLLYNWPAIMDSRGVAPAGWHIPSPDEWGQLISYLGSAAGGKLKEKGVAYWNPPNSGATNEFCFSARPSGNRGVIGQFNAIGEFAFWWTTGQASINDDIWGVIAGVNNLNHNFSMGSASKWHGYAIRCVKD